MMIELRKYNKDMAGDWDAFIKISRTPTLLHLRPYMDYHQQRFEDASLVFVNEKGHIVAVLPACVSNKSKDTVCSHEGLTYGGFICAPHLHCEDLSKILSLTKNYYHNQLQATLLRIKPAPYIYSAMPAQDELYMLTRAGAVLEERHLSQTIRLAHPARMSELRRRSIAKARRNGVEVCLADSKKDWQQFHALLTDVLTRRHNVRPVHSVEELLLLHQRFPNDIRLYAARKDGVLLAGTVVYLSPQVAHTQYLASSDEGRQLGALDLAIDYLIHDPVIREREYLDFGVSTERDGTLNPGLAAQKEGFGATGVCYDTYLLNLNN